MGRQPLIDGSGRRSEKDGDPVPRGGQARFKSRDLGLRLGFHRAGLVEVQAADQSRLIAPAGDLAGFRLEGEVLPGDRDPGLKRADLDVIDGELGGQRNLRVMEARDRRFERRRGRLQGSSRSTEDVRLPAGVEFGLIAGRGRPVAGRGCLGPARVQRGIHRGKQIGRGHPALGARLAQTSPGQIHGRAGLESRLDKRREEGIAELLPPP